MNIAERPNSGSFSTPSLQVGLRASPLNEQSWDAVLYDGQSVLIREIRKQDAELERRFTERRSPPSLQFHFLGTQVSPPGNLLHQLVVLDSARDVALIALISEGGEQSEIGVARLSANGDDTCELAVTVGHEWHNKGLGTLLMQHLICSAMDSDITAIHSSDAADNEPMREFAALLGFMRAPDLEDPTRVVHSLDLSARRV